MRRKKHSSLFLLCLVFIVLTVNLSSCSYKHYKGFQLVSNADVHLPTVFDSTFNKATYLTTFKIFKSDLSGITVIKKVKKTNTFHVVFMSQIGLKYFDLVVKMGKPTDWFKVNYIMESLNKEFIVKVLQSLLAEGIPVRDIRTIAETLAEHAVLSQDTGVLTAAVRVALSRSIVQQLVGPTEEIPVVVLDPGLEQILQQSLLSSDGGGAGFEPGLAEQMQKALVETATQREMAGESTILLVAAPIRQWIARFVKHSVPGMQVLSYNEIPDNRQIKVVATVGKSGGELGSDMG